MKNSFVVNCRLTSTTVALAFLVCAGTASAAQIIAVDYQGSAGDSPSTTPVTQSGFTAVSSNSASLPGGYGLTTTPSFANGGGSGFFTRAGVTNSGSFTEAALYQDFFYSQNNSFGGNPSATIEISGLIPHVQYGITFYTYDQSITIEGSNPPSTPFTTSFVGTGATSGTGTVASYVPNVIPTANEAYTSTGTYISTTGTIDILAQITSNHDFLRINGFTVTAADVRALVADPLRSRRRWPGDGSSPPAQELMASQNTEIYRHYHK